MSPSRSYVQTTRAAATEKTRLGILDATVALVREQSSVDFVLGDVAAASGVSVQTLLRHFGSREGLFTTAVAYAMDQVAAERAAPPGDPHAAVGALFDHYESWGPIMLRLLALNSVDAGTITEQGRRLHREWVRHAFAPGLAGVPAAQREAITDLLVIATDLYTWRLLVLDLRLPRPDAEDRVRRLITAILGEG